MIRIILVSSRVARNAACVLALLLISYSVQSAEPPGKLEQLKSPQKLEQLKKARALQAELAKRQPDLHIRRNDSKARHHTSIVGVPDEMEEITVYDRREIEDALRDVLPRYLGFIGRESFQFKEKRQDNSRETWYTFQQLISGIPVHLMELRVIVNHDTARITDIRGGVQLDIGFPDSPGISKQEAIEVAIAENPDRYLPPSDTGHSASPVYLRKNGRYELGMEVHLAVKSPDLLSLGIEYEYWYVLPDGETRSSVQVEYQARVCDGAEADIPHCGSTPTFYPLVIDTNGQCQVPYDCSGTDNKYRVPHETASGVEAMWGDLLNDTSCCDIGENNPDYGGNVDIMVDYPQETLGIAQYIHQVGRTERATIVHPASGGWPDNPDVTAHEMGHGYITLKAESQFKTSGDADLSVKQENSAVKESIADLTAIVWQNYDQSPPFDPDNRQWSTVGGDASIQFNYDDMTRANCWGPNLDQCHGNGRVGLHAFYELVQNTGFEQAAAVLFKSIEMIVDANDDTGVSFAELRDAMVTAAGSDDALVAAITTAWEDVGVVSSMGSGPGEDPNDGGPGSGAPGTISGSISGSFVQCVGSYSQDFVDWNSVSNATFYAAYFDGGQGLVFSGTVSQSQGYAYISGYPSGNWYFSACNDDGCGPLSATYYQVNHCL